MANETGGALSKMLGMKPPAKLISTSFPSCSLNQEGRDCGNEFQVKSAPVCCLHVKKKSIHSFYMPVKRFT